MYMFTCTSQILGDLSLMHARTCAHMKTPTWASTYTVDVFS